MISLPAFLVDSPLPGLRRPLAHSEADQVCIYLNTLIKWQRVHRLVGSIEPAWLAEHVVADSLAFLAPLPDSLGSLADVGSGAGIPGIPIAIVRPEVRITLIEARQRRVSFLSTVVRELGLVNVEVLSNRVEDLEQSHADRFDAVVSRCAAPARDIAPAMLRIVRPGGIVVISTAATAETVLNGERLSLRTPDGSTRWFQRFVKR